jgi:exosome complex component RRP41
MSLGPGTSSSGHDSANDVFEGYIAKSVCEALTAAVFLERYPKCKISLEVTVMSAEGGEVPMAITAASLALAAAGIAMRDLVVGCTALHSASKESFLMDPTSNELRAADAAPLSMALMTASGRITFCDYQGDREGAIVKNLAHIAHEGCSFVHSVVAAELRSYAAKLSPELEDDEERIIFKKPGSVRVPSAKAT